MDMARKGKSTKEIIAFLREAEVRLARGETAGKICRGAGISEQTYYKWRREYGGLKIDQAKRLMTGIASRGRPAIAPPI
jgi:putative transposase